jgi:PPK2 family polyphosphate:nucleotide phosphotransferase
MNIKLNTQPTTPPKNLDKKKIKKETTLIINQIATLQNKMYAQSKHSILIVLQGMDASGKDGIVKKTFSNISPNGIKTVSFKKPTKEEFAHDFLWRIHKHAPAKGMITIFNRSHYEDILVPSVYGYLNNNTINQRFEIINDFEKLLRNNNTHVLKFYLNVSANEQYLRLKERMELEEKHWKHNDGDWEVRKKRTDFESVYEQILKKCNTPAWHIVPADVNWYKTYFVANTVLKLLKSLDLTWPKLDTALPKVPANLSST